jgi:hypothetical protein
MQGDENSLSLIRAEVTVRIRRRLARSTLAEACLSCYEVPVSQPIDTQALMSE